MAQLGVIWQPQSYTESTVPNRLENCYKMLKPPTRPLIWVLLTTMWLGRAGPIDSTSDQLKRAVTIYRDTYGVPHILGDSEPATFFGYGYAQAQDHLAEMMKQYRDAQGRLSEVLGSSALGQGYLSFDSQDYRWGGDYLQRLLRTWKCVIEHRQDIDRTVYPLIDAFARGVNLFIAEHREHIPSWIDQVRADDVEALMRSHFMRFYSIDDAMSKIPGQRHAYPNLVPTCINQST